MASRDDARQAGRRTRPHSEDPRPRQCLGAADPQPDRHAGDRDQEPDRGQGLRRRSRTARSHRARSEEHTSELQSLMRISYAVFCLKKKTYINSYSTLTHCSHTTYHLRYQNTYTHYNISYNMFL